jgi:hypothetical protein
MKVENGPAKATVRWHVTGPRTIYDYTSNQADINSGFQAPYAPAIIPQDAPSGTYRLAADVTFNGTTATRTNTFVVETPATQQPEPAHPQAYKYAKSISDFINLLQKFDPSGPLTLLEGSQIGACITYQAGRVTKNPAALALNDECERALNPRIEAKCTELTDQQLPQQTSVLRRLNARSISDRS